MDLRARALLTRPYRLLRLVRLLRPLRLSLAIGCGLALAFPAAAQLRVVSAGSQQVLEYAESDGSFLGAFIETVSAGFAFPGGIAVRPSDGRLYVASSGSGEIWVYDTPTGLALPPPAATGLLAPMGLAFDPTGSTLYFIADIPNGPDSDAALRKLELPGGAVSTLASDGTASFSAVALEGSQLYVSDSFNGEVVRFATSGGNGTTVVSGLQSPGGIAFPSSTRMLIAETSADRVVEYQESGGNWSFVQEVLPASAGVDGPFGLALAPDGRLSVSGAQSNDVVAVDLTSLAVTPLVAPGAGGLTIAGEVAWSGNTLLVASRGSNSVLYYDSLGNPTGTTASGLTSPPDAGLAQTASGNLVVASAADNSITEYDGSSGGAVQRRGNACPESFTEPVDVAVDGAGDVYIACGPSGSIRYFDGIGVSQALVLGGTGGLSTPRSLAFGPGGNLFVANLSGEVLEYDGASGAFVGVFVDTTGNGGGPLDPYGLLFHQGSLFVASSFPNEVKEFDAVSGAFVQTFVSAGSGGLSGPTNLAFGPSGDLFVTSQGDDSIKRYDGASGAFVASFVTSGSGGLDQPFDLAFAGGAPIPVPALSAPARALLVGALGALGACVVWAARRRGRAARRTGAA
jgi:DNA-binding beta-propeller fold protein YncE